MPIRSGGSAGENFRHLARTWKTLLKMTASRSKMEFGRWRRAAMGSSLVQILLTCMLSGCAQATAAGPTPDPTVRALENQIAALNAHLERVQSAASVANTTVLAVEPTMAPLAPDPEPDPTTEPSPTPFAFPTRAPRVITAADAAPCQLGQIKGNRNSKIYHVPGGGSYSQTKANVQCFPSESEAQAAGYRKALN
jgi:hypothetical protein